MDPVYRANQASVEIRNLIGFRIELLKRFIWIHQIAGSDPAVPDHIVVPDHLSDRDTQMRHAVTAARILTDYEKREDAYPATHASFKTAIEEAVCTDETEDRPQSAGAVLKGVKDILSVMAESSSTQGDNLFATLYEHRRKIEEYAAEMGISPWG
jgi:hypothetical protein